MADDLALTASDALSPRPTRVPSVPLARLVALVDTDLRLPREAPAGQPPDVPDVTGMTLRSQSVRPGDLYAALAGGRTHGAQFAPAAAGSGCAAFVTDPAGAQRCLDSGRPTLVVDTPRSRIGLLAREVYGAACDAVRTIGVTGTSGKTTTTYLLEGGLRAGGGPTALIGTTGTWIAGRPVASALTTPEAPELHALFAVMRENDVRDCAMEVSSHALVQGRVDGVMFDVAVFLNLGRDHLDFHADLEDYFAAKASLFTPARARRAVVNVDDAHGRRLADQTDVPVVTFSAAGRPGADWRAADIEPTPTGTRFALVGPDGARVPASCPLPGAFNVANALAALAALAVLGKPVEAAAAGVAASHPVPGRMEQVHAGQPYRVLVDYAHKPDAVEAVLSALRPVTAGRLLLVLGAGGDRDPGKRALMGRIAARQADVVVVTDDNPRTENPAEIRAALLAGARAVVDGANLVELADRATAIRHAVSIAAAGDCVVIAGKGHERGQEVDGVVHPFDDRAVARRAVREQLQQSGPCP